MQIPDFIKRRVLMYRLKRLNDRAAAEQPQVFYDKITHLGHQLMAIDCEVVSVGIPCRAKGMGLKPASNKELYAHQVCVYSSVYSLDSPVLRTWLYPRTSWKTGKYMGTTDGHQEWFPYEDCAVSVGIKYSADSNQPLKEE